MLRIRLQRRGRRKRPIHHIVVADSRKPRDGRIVEDLGRFDNVTPNNQLDLNRDRALYWLKEGAQPTDTVRSIFKKQGLMYQMHLIRWGKSEEEIEEALQEWREKRAEKDEDVPTRKERQQALLDAEEKEFQKQLQKKAEEAAREKAKQEALASEEEEDDDAEETSDEADEQDASEAEETTASDDAAEAEEAAEETADNADDESDDSGDEETVEQETEAMQQETASEDQPQEDAADEEQETTEEKPAGEAADAQDEDTEDTEASEEEDASDEEEEEAPAADSDTSTGMLAKDAIEHIENNSVEDLEGFVTDEEDRVTVRRAWEDKQEEG